MSNIVRLKAKEATPSESPGTYHNNAVVKLYFKGDMTTAALLEEAILKALGRSVNQ